MARVSYHTFLAATHTRIICAFTPQLHSITALWFAAPGVEPWTRLPIAVLTGSGVKQLR